MRLLAVIAALATIAPWGSAQRAASGSHAPAQTGTPRFNLPSGNFAPGRNAHPSGFRRSSAYPYASSYTSLPFPFFGDSFDPDDIYSTGYPVASQPPPFLLQALSEMAGPAANSMGPAMSSPNGRDSSSSQPLMIELQNGRYVRVNSIAADGDALPLAPNPAQAAKTSSRPTRLTPSQPPLIATASPAQSLPPAVLIFRDGHREEVGDYTIADGFLYARGDYYTDGYWNKKIDLSTLNLNQTLQANADRSVKFVLPSSPNEVITRP
jgi:hypothetical protein